MTAGFKNVKAMVVLAYLFIGSIIVTPKALDVKAAILKQFQDKVADYNSADICADNQQCVLKSNCEQPGISCSTSDGGEYACCFLDKIRSVSSYEESNSTAEGSSKSQSYSSSPENLDTPEGVEHRSASSHSSSSHSNHNNHASSHNNQKATGYQHGSNFGYSGQLGYGIPQQFGYGYIPQNYFPGFQIYPLYPQFGQLPYGLGFQSYPYQAFHGSRYNRYGSYPPYLGRYDYYRRPTYSPYSHNRFW